MSYNPHSLSGQSEIYNDPRAMQNLGAKADTVRCIEAALEDLSRRIEGLNKIISDLDSKLAPYLQPELSNKAQVTPPSPTNKSRVVNKIESFAIEIDNARAFLYTLMERLD